MTDETPTPDANPPASPEASTPPPAPAAAAPTPPPAPAAPVAAAPAPAATRRKGVTVPVWALVTIIAVLGAAVMFGVGYLVGDGNGHDGPERAGGPSAQSGPFGGQIGRGNQGGQINPHSGGQFGGGQLGGGTSPLGGGQLGGGTSPLGGGSGSGGQQVQPSSPASGAFLGVATQQDTNGVKIAQVASGSAAEKAGLQVGDVITHVQNAPVASTSAFSTQVRSVGLARLS